MLMRFLWLLLSLLRSGGVPLISRWVQALQKHASRIHEIVVVTNKLNHQSFVQWASQYAGQQPAIKLVCEGSTSNEVCMRSHVHVCVLNKAIPTCPPSATCKHACKHACMAQPWATSHCAVAGLIQTRSGALAAMQLGARGFSSSEADDLIIIGGDTLFLSDFDLGEKLAAFDQHPGASLLLSYNVSDERTHKCGILEVDRDTAKVGCVCKALPFHRPVARPKPETEQQGEGAWGQRSRGKDTHTHTHSHTLTHLHTHTHSCTHALTHALALPRASRRS